MKNNYHILSFLFLFCFGISGIDAQEAIVTAGCNSNSENGSVSFTVGQVCYSLLHGTTCTAAEGVHQPFEISSPTGIGKDNDIRLLYHIYPNPTSKILHLNVNETPSEKLGYQVYNIEGKLLMYKDIHQVITPIDFTHLPSTVYILKVIDKKKKTINSFKIIKK